MFELQVQLTSNCSEKLCFCFQGFHFGFDLDFECAESLSTDALVDCLGQGLCQNDPKFMSKVRDAQKLKVTVHVCFVCFQTCAFLLFCGMCLVKTHLTAMKLQANSKKTMIY